MKRDGHNKSIWQEMNLPKYHGEVSEQYDVVVVGGGITGISTALKLQEAGRTCLIIEAHELGFGTTGGTSAHLNTVLDIPYSEIINLHGLEKAIQVMESTREAIAFIRNNVDYYQIDCNFQRSSGYMYAENDKEKEELVKIGKAIKQVGIACEPIESIPIPAKFDYAIKFAEQGHFHPTRYLGGILAAFLALKGSVLEQTVVTQVKEQDNHLLVQTSTGITFIAKNVVYATHTPPGVQLMSFRLAPYRSYIQVWNLNDARVELRDVVYDMKDPFHYIRSVKEGDQSYIMVGGQDHKTGTHHNAQINFLELEAFIRATFHVSEKAYQWSSQYYESQDSLPFIGFHPGFGGNNVYLATGFGGNGMIFGSLSAKIISDILINEHSNYQDLYSPVRFGPFASIKDFLSDNLNVAKHLLADRFTIDKLGQLAEIAKGQGKVLKYEGKDIGVYKDEEGRIHTVSPLCMHAGCVVKWNNAESSWDCPCHGARYSSDGKLLNGPSTKDLRSIQMTQNQK